MKIYSNLLIILILGIWGEYLLFVKSFHHPHLDLREDGVNGCGEGRISYIAPLYVFCGVKQSMYKYNSKFMKQLLIDKRLNRMPFTRQQLLFILITILCFVIILLLYMYIESYTQNLPFLDEWHYSVLIATQAADGNIDFDLIFRVNDAHRNVLSNIFTVIFAKYFSWNLRLAMLVNFGLGVSNWGLALFILYRQQRRQALMLALPLAILMLSLLGGTTWLVSYYSFWIQTSFFVLLILLIISISQPRWSSLIAIIILAVILTFTSAPGMVMWVVIVLLMPFYGYHRKRYFLAVILVGIIIIALYLRGSGISTIETSATQNSLIQIRNLQNYPYFLFLYLRNVLGQALPNYGMSSVLTLSAIFLTMLNIVYLLRRKIALREITIWLGLIMYILGATSLKFIGRINNGLIPYMPNWYIQSATLFWIAVIVIGAKTLVQLYDIEKRQSWHKFYAASIISFQVLITSFLLYNNVQHLIDMNRIYYPLQIQRTAYSDIENCALDYVFSRDYSCQDAYEWGTNYQYLIDGLASRRLTIFAEIELQQIIPEYQNELLVLDIESFNISLNFQTYFLDGIPRNQILFIPHDLSEISSIEYWETEIEPITVFWYITDSNLGEFEHYLLETYQRQNEFTIKGFQGQQYRIRND